MNRNILLWALYDFANSISTIVFFLYYAQWLVIDNKIDDIWFNLLFVGSTILLILTAPIFASRADKKGIWVPSLKIVTILQFLLLFLISILVLIYPTNKTIIIATAVLFLFANFFYQFCLIFYSALLPTLTTKNKLGFISGIGHSANWLGSIAGILLTFPLANGTIKLFNASSRAETLLPATLVSFVLTLPMLFFFAESKKGKLLKGNAISEYKNFWKTFLAVWKVPGLGIFLLGYFFFSDALTTASNNFAIYLEQVFKIPDTTKSLLLLGILFTASVGAFLSGWVADKVGLKKSVFVVLGSWLFIFPAMSLTTNFPFFIILTVLMGFFFGATWAITRAIVAFLSPPNMLNSTFGQYVLFERFATFFGPLSWGLITYSLQSYGEIRYRIALFSMTIFILIGLIVIRNLPGKKNQ